MKDKGVGIPGGVRQKWVPQGDGTCAPLVVCNGGGGGGNSVSTLDKAFNDGRMHVYSEEMYFQGDKCFYKLTCTKPIVIHEASLSVETGGLDLVLYHGADLFGDFADVECSPMNITNAKASTITISKGASNAVMNAGAQVSIIRARSVTGVTTLSLNGSAGQFKIGLPAGTHCIEVKKSEGTTSYSYAAIHLIWEDVE